MNIDSISACCVHLNFYVVVDIVVEWLRSFHIVEGMHIESKLKHDRFSPIKWGKDTM